VEHGVRDRLVVSFLYTVFMITTFFSLTLQCLNLGIPKPPANFTWIYLPKLLRNLPAKKYQITWSLPLNYLHQVQQANHNPFSRNYHPLCLCQFVLETDLALRLTPYCLNVIQELLASTSKTNIGTTKPSFWYKLLLSNQGKNIF